MNDQTLSQNQFGISLDNIDAQSNASDQTAVNDFQEQGWPVSIPMDAAEEQIRRETYSEEELLNVNAITVTIPDEETPIVVLFGAQSSGKTLVLLRMIRWLEVRNFRVIPEYTFRPGHDKHFQKMCEKLHTIATAKTAPDPTDNVNFMLNRVLDSVGNPLFQFLEAPGEHYFNPENPNEPFPTYINQMRTRRNRKIWVFLVEQNWGKDQGQRNMYARKICQMRSLMSPKDKVVFLINKVDKLRDSQYIDALPNKQVFFNNIANQYPNIFSKYTRKGFEAFLYGKYNFKVVCFSSGTFNENGIAGKEMWTPEDDWYCAELWNALKA